MSVVEHQCREAAVGEPLGERSQARRLDATDTVRHHHNGVRTAPVGQIEPGVDLLTLARRYPNVAPLAHFAAHAPTLFDESTSAPASLASSAPNSAPGVNAPGLPDPSAKRVATEAATRAVNV
jgi:hypothetical protein